LAYQINKCKKTHHIGELPAAIQIVKTMFGENCAKPLQHISLSNDTVGRRITDISRDIVTTIVEIGWQVFFIAV